MYSLPIHGNACFKIGFDAGGNRVDPDKRNFIPDRKREEAISDYCKKLTPEVCITLDHHIINTLKPRQNGRHFTDDISKCIFLYENVWIWISLKVVPKGPINNIPALVQIMAWRRPGDKPLSEPMMVRLPTHICVTRPQWVNTLRPKQMYCHFADDIFKFVSFKESCRVQLIN